MAYLHCHNCDWQQDDFWDFSWRKYGYWHGWRYNPISLFLSYIDTYWKPRRHKFDRHCAEENRWLRNDPFSWWLIWFEFRRMIRKFKRQKWWTEKAYQNDIKKLCPECGSENLDID